VLTEKFLLVADPLGFEFIGGDGGTLSVFEMIVFNVNV
jgi:hypothetical protein